MLVIEQFQNPELAKLQTRQNYSDVMQYFTGLIKYLIRQGVLREDDSEIMAAQLCLPISTFSVITNMRVSASFCLTIVCLCVIFYLIRLC